MGYSSANRFPGTGLFIGSGKALEVGGPASLLIAFCLVGLMLFCMIHALGEMAVLLPVAGSFSTYSSRFLDPSWGFAIGWVRSPMQLTKRILIVEELWLAMARRPTARSHCCVYHGRLLGPEQPV